MGKAQSSAEFLIVTSFILFSFTVFVAIINQNMSQKMFENQDSRVREIASIVQEEINFASGSVTGYYREFRIPESIGQVDYEIKIIDSHVYIETSDKKHASSLQVGNITGNPKKGANKILKNDSGIFLNI